MCFVQNNVRNVAIFCCHHLPAETQSTDCWTGIEGQVNINRLVGRPQWSSVCRCHRTVARCERFDRLLAKKSCWNLSTNQDRLSAEWGRALHRWHVVDEGEDYWDDHHGELFINPYTNVPPTSDTRVAVEVWRSQRSDMRHTLSQWCDITVGNNKYIVHWKLMLYLCSIWKAQEFDAWQIWCSIGLGLWLINYVAQKDENRLYL